MSSGTPPSGGFRGFLKDGTRRVKKVFERRSRADESHMPSPLPPRSPGTPPQSAPAHERLPQSATQSPQSVISPQPVPSTSQPTHSVSPLAPEAIQSTHTDPGLTQAAKKAGAEAWLGLKTTLQVLEKSDIFLPLKPAVSGFLEVFDMFKEQKGILEEQKAIVGEQQLDARLKELNAALKAMYDSKLSTVVGRRRCTPGTREAILAEMQKWANDPESAKVYWLNGMAGTGKTTLAYSFCDGMQLASRLGASFFCSRTDPESRDVSKIVPTIAHQLARLIPSYREELIRHIGKDKDISERTAEAQFEKLIRAPLCEIKASVSPGIVIVIDALDECDQREGAQDILKILFRHARDLPIKFFVTCRPAPGLFDTLDSKDERDRSVLHLHDIEASFVQADISTYLEAELGDLSLPHDKLGQLADQAGNLFIYAATAVRYIYPKAHKVNHRHRLDNLLSITSELKTNKHKGIDDLYSAILAAAFADDDTDPIEKENIRLVLDTAVCAREPMSVSTMTKLLGLDEEEDTMLALQHLRSVLHVSHHGILISTLHASFPDFMLSRERSGDRCCKAMEHNQHLALCCFSTMQRLLRFNICNLESSFVFDKNIPGLEKKADAAILPELFYACRYWGDHLGLVDLSTSARSALDEFLCKRLLFWMEVMNLRNCIGVGTQMLSQAHRWLQKSGEADDTLELALDAEKFASMFAMSAASRSTPHIYISALPFWPKTRPVGLRYWQHTRGLMRLEGSAMQGRDLSCLATWATAHPINCVAFSSDGTHIVSGSSDNTIRVWGAYGGDVVAGPFKGHTDSVNSVAFSSDCTRIVSGSSDNTIRVWDARNGDVVAGPFKGHTDSVYSVAFSSDCTRIVSGSSDNTIRVWDAHSGDTVAGPFKGHTDLVKSVAFSSDDTRIVSGSNDDTIRVWYASTLDMHNSQPFSDWTMDEEGLVTTQQGQLLLCVPADLHTGLLRPQNTLCIYRKGILSLDFNRVSFGRDWVQCYRC